MGETRKTTGKNQAERAGQSGTSTKNARARRLAKKRAQMRKRILLISGAVAGLALIASLGYYSGAKTTVENLDENVICNNIFIDGIDVSGMTADEVQTAIEKNTKNLDSVKMNLVADSVSTKVALSELGFRVQNIDKVIEKALEYGKEGSVWERYSEIKALKNEKKEFVIAYTVEPNLVKQVLEEKMPALEKQGKDATIKLENGKFVITDEVEGSVIDAEKSIKEIENYLNNDWNRKSGRIQLVVTTGKPKITKEDLMKIQDVLGKYTTNCGTGGGRVQNIITGTGLINGSVIMPGEVFSADAAMRPYTYDNGFTTAGSYENGKVVQSMGGGICQVSSTLYNACILAELEITQRQAHSMLVSYVEPSMDAAIAGDVKDLKFKNNTDTPIYIEGYVSGGYVTFVIYGKETREESRTIKYVSETLSTTPAGKKFQASSSAIGSISQVSSGYTGKTAKLWKVVYENGKEVSREQVNSSSYRSSEAIYSVGTASSSAKATQLVKNAIATQNEKTIREAIDKAIQIIKDEQEAAQKPSTPSKPSTPETTDKPENNSGQGETQQPEANPGQGETQQPETNPGQGETQQPEANPGQGETQQPEANPDQGETQQPETNSNQGTPGQSQGTGNSSDTNTTETDTTSVEEDNNTTTESNDVESGEEV